MGFVGWGAGPGPDPLPGAWGGSLGALSLTQMLLGGLPPELGGEGTSVPLGYLGWPNFNYYILRPDAAAKSGAWENNHPVKVWPGVRPDSAGACSVS